MRKTRREAAHRAASGAMWAALALLGVSFFTMLPVTVAVIVLIGTFWSAVAVYDLV